MKPITEAGLLTSMQVGNILGLTHDKVRTLRLLGILKAINLGPGIGWRFSRWEIEKYSRKGT